MFVRVCGSAHERQLGPLLHPDDELALVAARRQGLEGELGLVQAVDPLPHLPPVPVTQHNSRYDIIASYRVKFAFVDQLAEVVQHAAVQGGGPPVLDRAAG